MRQTEMQDGSDPTTHLSQSLTNGIHVNERLRNSIANVSRNRVALQAFNFGCKLPHLGWYQYNARTPRLFAVYFTRWRTRLHSQAMSGVLLSWAYDHGAERVAS